jgi:hypothetical protein
MGFLHFAGTILDSLFKKPVTTTYPAKPAVLKPEERGRVVIDIQKCISAAVCACANVLQELLLWTVPRKAGPSTGMPVCNVLPAWIIAREMSAYGAPVCWPITEKKEIPS